MHTEIEGPEAAPDVVCLHGGIGTGRYHWSRQIDALAAEHRVHLPDLPGHGHTPVPEGVVYDRDVLADALETYLSKLDRTPHVVGFSMGGHTALHLAARRPDLFASLALVGVATADHDGLRRWRERFDPNRLEAAYPVWTKALARLHAPLGPEAWREVCRRDAGGALDVTADLEALAGLDCPTLLVRGDRDPVVTAEQYAALRRVWPHADELVVPAGGHDVQLTRHTLVRPALLDFLDRAQRSRPKEA